MAREGNQLTLLSATPNAGWAVEVEQDAGAEIEVDFRRDGQRVQVNVEVEETESFEVSFAQLRELREPPG